MRVRATTVLLLGLCVLAAPDRSEAGPARPDALLEGLRAAEPVTAEAVAVSNRRVVLGPVAFEIAEGVIVPVKGEGAPVAELVFLGEAWLIADAPDEIEAGQLELFTGRRRLREQVTEAVLATCLDAAVASLLEGEPTSLEASRAARVAELWQDWSSGHERELLGVEGALWLHALGDPMMESYFAGRFETPDDGALLAWVDPEAREQVGLGRFVALELDARERRKAQKQLHREQRRGRLLGQELEDLGVFDTWMSTALRTPDGQAYFGSDAFAAEHYRLEVELTGRDESLSGRGSLRLRALTGSRRGLRLQLHPDLLVSSLRGPGGEELPRVREGSSILAILPEAPAIGESFEVELAWSGKAFERLERGLFRLVDTVHWHPRVALAEERATYDVTLGWPKGLDLAASGQLVERLPEQGGLQRERRGLQVPSAGFSFEIGRFEWERFRVGDMEVALAFDKESKRAEKDQRRGLSWAVRDSLAWYTETLGPPPVDSLTVVTVPRGFSQGLPGFVTLSSLHLAPEDIQRWLGIEDPRTIVAHELAHQWWGNAVGFRSYRDEWLSEGIASWLALAWSARIPSDDRPVVGSTVRWRSPLTGVTAEGRPVESLGPIVLGRRLNSSLSEVAFQGIVYDKGALVLNGLAASLGQEQFLQALNAVQRVAAGKLLDTESFFRILEKETGRDLDAFVAAWVEGTGIPTIWYSSEFVPAETGRGWTVELSIEQKPSYSWSYGVQPAGEGWSLRRRAEPRLEVGAVPLTVHFGLSIDDPARGKKKDGDGANAVLRGRLVLDQPTMTFSIPVQHEPKRFTLDPKGQDFGTFVDLGGDPRDATLARAWDAAASGEPDRAVEILLADPELLAGDLGDRRDDEGMSHATKRMLRVVDRSVAQAALAELLIESGRLDEAQAPLEDLDRLPAGQVPQLVQWSHDRLRAQLAVARGDGKAALELYKRRLGRKDPVLSGADWAIVAVAAHMTGDAELARRGREEAEERGIDMSALAATS